MPKGMLYRRLDAVAAGPDGGSIFYHGTAVRVHVATLGGSEAALDAIIRAAVDALPERLGPNAAGDVVELVPGASADVIELFEHRDPSHFVFVVRAPYRPVVS